MSGELVMPLKSCQDINEWKKMFRGYLPTIPKYMPLTTSKRSARIAKRKQRKKLNALFRNKNVVTRMMFGNNEPIVTVM